MKLIEILRIAVSLTGVSGKLGHFKQHYVY
jgi:hypothetical protein